MVEFLFKRLIKDFDDAKNPSVREKCGKTAGVLGIASNALLAAIKLIAGLLSGSISIVADAVNNLSDAGASVITLIGFRLSGMPADDDHPYGHARIEYISGFIISFIMVFIGFEFMVSSVERIITPVKSEFTVLTVVILLLSIAIKAFQCLMYRRIGRHISSSALSASAQDSLNDAVTTTVVLLGITVTLLTKINLDGWLGLAVSLFIIYSGIRLVIETADPLLGTAPDAELVGSISDAIRSYDGIIGIHDLMIHNYGPDRCFVTAHVEVPAERDVIESHDIIDNIEFDFLKKNIHLVLHLDPVVTENDEINRLRGSVCILVGELFPGVTVHDFRVVFGVTHTNLLFDVTVPMSFKTADSAICYKISEAVKAKFGNYNTVITVDRNYTSKTIIN